MRYISILILTLSFALPSYGQKVKVRRVKGNQAIVDIESGNLRPGQTYELSRDLYTDGAFSPESRRNVFSVTFSLLSAKGDGNANTTNTSIQGKLRYGWNHETMEFGFLGAMSYVNDTNTTQSFRGGGFFDFNLLPNIPGEIFIYGLGAQALIGQYEANNSSLSLMDLYGTGFVKWFPKGGTVGVRVDAGVIMQNVSGNSSSSTTGLTVEASLIGYF